MRARHARARSRPMVRVRATVRAVAFAAGMVAWPALLPAQLERSPELGGRTASLGQPPKLLWQTGLLGGVFLHAPPEDRLTAQAFLGVSYPLLNPVAGVGSIGFEGYLGPRGAQLDAGLRLLARIPYAGLGAGLDYSARDGGVAALLTLYGPVRRGGIISSGGLLRIDVVPQRSSLTVGVSLPLGERFAGIGRPRRDYVIVAGDFQQGAEYHVDDPVLRAQLDTLRTSAEWIRRLTAPFLDHDGRTARIAEQRSRIYLAELQGRLAERSVAAEVLDFHARLEHLFVLASGRRESGLALAAGARGMLLDEVLLPYNRLLGQKKREDTLADLATAASGRFSRWVTSSQLVAPDRTEHVLFVFQQLTAILDEVRATATREWNDPRLVWLPLQYALRPDEHDDRHELASLVERATGVPFTEHNRIRYVANLQFHWELLRSIRETQDYHVLWVHDFPAVSEGRLDPASAEQVVDGYLSALAEHVEQYDRKGGLPSWFIFLDEFYYQSRRSRILMDILEDPLGATADLPRGVSGDTEGLSRALTRLRSAVAGSRVLQAEAREYGEAWLRNRVKVHVNITHRTDPSFWSGALVGTIFGYPDNIMRDHRKIAFRDVDEAYPERGAAILTGMGVGEQYLGPGWEDRSLMVAGPVLLGLKTAARELLLSQGLPAAELPMALRPDALPAPLDTDVAADGAPATRAALLVNGTGYLPKPLNVAKAVLYSLMPPGSVLKIPDSLWNSTFFGALLAGASLRGCTVSITAPALANAPSSGFPQMARAHELFVRLLLVREQLAQALRAAGGELRLGLYALEPDRDGFSSRAAAWVRQVGPAPAGRVLGAATPALVAVVTDHARDPGATAPVPALRPRLHQKVQYLATAGFWEEIARSPEWPLFMSTYLRYREVTYDVGGGRSGPAAERLANELEAIARRMYASAGRAPRAASWALVGSQNMDYRGMFMDGEVGMLFDAADSLVPLIDLLFLEGTVTPIDDRATLDRLLPPPSELKRRFARVLKDAT